MRLKGKLVIIGGSEDKGEGEDFENNGILSRIIKESAHGASSRIEIVTAASELPDEVGEDYIKAFGRLKANNCGVLKFESREEAFDPANIKRLEASDVIFVTGGDQLRLTSILGGTPFFDLMQEKLSTGKFIYAGTSAGAAAVSDTMIIRGNSDEAFLKGEIKTTGGFGLIDNIVFDTHFITRGRIGRLFQIIVSNPKVLGVGLEENTALMINGSGKMEAIGPGMAILVDGRYIKNSNLLEVRDAIPLSIDNVIVHVMSQTDVYDLKTHELSIITPEECKV